MKRLIAACMLAGAGVSSLALAATVPETLTRLSLGAPFPRLPLCADVRTPDGDHYKALCSEPLSSDGSMVSIGFPDRQRPDVMDGNKAVAVIDGPTMVGLILPTQGAKTDATVLAALTKAFGKPLRVEREAVKAAGGKSVQAIHAGWISKPMTVEMYAIPDQPNTGTIELLLAQARPLMDGTAALAAAEASAPASQPGAGQKKKGW